MDRQYEVSLVGWAELAAAARICAEVRFAAELEYVLGGPDGVMAAWAAYERLIGEPRGSEYTRPETAYARAIKRAEARGWDGLAARPMSAAFSVRALVHRT
jgi:hypothetical protein